MQAHLVRDPMKVPFQLVCADALEGVMVLSTHMEVLFFISQTKRWSVSYQNFLGRQDELHQPTVEGFGKAIVLRSVESREAGEHPMLVEEACRAVSSVLIVTIQSREFDVHVILSAKASSFGRDGRVKDLSSVESEP